MFRHTKSITDRVIDAAEDPIGTVKKVLDEVVEHPELVVGGIILGSILMDDEDENDD